MPWMSIRNVLVLGVLSMLIQCRSTKLRQHFFARDNREQLLLESRIRDGPRRAAAEHPSSGIQRVR